MPGKIWCRRSGGAVFAFLFWVMVAGRAAAEPGIDGPDITAAAAVLVDRDSGSILYEKNAFRRRDPASTTKIMTAILALELGRLDDVVKVSAYAASTPGSTMRLRAGDQYTLEQLLYGLLLESGNDAAVAIAEHLAGSEAAFATIMSQKAKEIGAWNTRFRNPHGLTEYGHYTTAHDLALIARYALRNRKFAELVATRDREVAELQGRYRATLYNTNQLLWEYKGAEGVKTGTTPAAGKCLVSAATRDGQRLIAVVLGSQDRWGDSVRLLEYGFARYDAVKVAGEGDLLHTVKVAGGVEPRLTLAVEEPLAAVVGAGQASRVRVKFEVPPYVRAPVARGQVVGVAVLYLGDRPLRHAFLVAPREVPARGLLPRVWSPFGRWLGWLAGRGLG